jgi:molybdopterin/thiamine biosynthesis adenylyltransferase
MEHLYLAKHAYFCMANDQGVIGIGSSQKIIQDIELWKCALEISQYLLDSNGVREIQIVNRFKGSFSKIKIKQSLSLLKDCQLLQPNHEHSEDRYNRNKLYYQSRGHNPNTIQEKLKQSNVAIVGCGGIGNIISTILATSGVGRLNLIDNDNIELSNLTRQFMFTESEVGLSKVATLAKEIKKRNSNTHIHEINKAILLETDLDCIKNVDLIVLSADSPKQLPLIVNSYCTNNNIPFVHVGYLNDISVVGPFYIPGISGCLNCGILNAGISERNDDEQLSAMMNNINSKCKGVSFPITNEIAAALATSDILKFLGGYDTPESINKKIGFCIDDLKLSFLDYSRNKKCKTC